MLTECVFRQQPERDETLYFLAFSICFVFCWMKVKKVAAGQKSCAEAGVCVWESQPQRDESPLVYIRGLFNLCLF